MDSNRHWNWRIWVGFLLPWVGIASYVFVFVRYPITRNVPWVPFLFFLVALILLIAGLRRAFGQPSAYRGKIAGPILAVLSVALMAFFAFGTLYATRQLPASKGAPKVGDKAPDFSLPDTHGKTLTLAELLTTPTGSAAKPPKGVLLIFYRGYW